MAAWEHGGGFSLDASVRIEAPDRAGLERLLRYCARAPFALDRLTQVNPEQLVYRLSKPRLDGCTALRLMPLERIDRLAALIPPPRPATVRIAWALLLARIDENFPLLCPQCGGTMRIIAFVTDAPTVRAILAHLGEPTAPPRIAPARGPPLWDAVDAALIDATPSRDPFAPPEPAYQFDQRIAWVPGRRARRAGSSRGELCQPPPTLPVAVTSSSANPGTAHRQHPRRPVAAQKRRSTRPTQPPMRGVVWLNLLSFPFPFPSFSFVGSSGRANPSLRQAAGQALQNGPRA